MKALKKAIAKAKIQTINKVLSKAKTQSSQRIRLIYNIKAADVKKRIILFRASGRKAAGHIAFMGKRLRLYHFGARQTKKQGVTVQVRRDRGRKALGSRYFIAPFKAGSDQLGIFMRKGKERYPIIQRYTVGVAEMFSNEIQDQIEVMVRKDSAETFRQQLKYYLSRAVTK